MRRRRVLVGMFLLVACSGGPDDESTEPPVDRRPASTIRMAELLDEISTELTQVTAVYRDDEYVSGEVESAATTIVGFDKKTGADKLRCFDLREKEK